MNKVNIRGAFSDPHLYRDAQLTELTPEEQVEMDLLGDIHGYLLKTWHSRIEPNRYYLVSPACQADIDHHWNPGCGCFTTFRGNEDKIDDGPSWDSECKFTSIVGVDKWIRM